ncbi:MAG: IS66 family transposase [Nevskia sp.]|nr:IS66 family transposase [Nevskia sp.]
MDLSALHTVSDIESLRSLAFGMIESRDAEIREHRRENHYKQTKIDALTAEIARLRRVQFAARSEAMNPEQRALFDDAITADIAAVETEIEALKPPTARSARQAPKRVPLPAHLPRVETRHEPESCTCGSCGTALTLIGEHVSEKLDCKPLEFFVRRDVHPQYACRACETVTAVPVAPAIIDRGIAAPGLLAQMLIAKYVDHVPLYRQEGIFARSGVTIPRSTQAEWAGICGVRLQPLVDAQRTELLASPVLHADETPVALLDPGAGKTRRAYLFAYRTAAADHPIVVFDFCTSRSGQHAARFLGDYRGALMVDDFAGYKALFERGITELGCMVHARRKFNDLYEANQSTQAFEALERFAAIYRIETAIKELDPQDRHRYRLLHAKPRLDDFHRWLVALRQTVLGGSGLAKAIDYSLKRWSALTRYLDDGRFPIDNNPVENSIRPIALGRKNWLFVGSESAGRRAAAIMSLLATAKANGHEPHAWLLDVLTRLPTTLNRDIGQLLPHRWLPPAAR